jgi:ABC-2 type transport system ATP-binding protein
MPTPTARPVARALRAAAVVLAGLTALPLASSAEAAAPSAAAGTRLAANHDQSFTKTPITIETVTGPDRDVPCTVKADLYRPTAATRRHKAPAILTTNGFGGAKDDDGQSAAASAFAEAGYVVLSYSGLGFGGSDCKITLDDPDWDGYAGKQIVDVLAGTRSYTVDDGSGKTGRIDYVATEGRARRHDPRVGMIGGSYGGQIQFAIAEQDPRIDAIIPFITWNDLSYSLAPNNTDTVKGVTYSTPGVAKKEWIDLFFGSGIADGLQNTQTDPTRNVGCPNFADQACASAAQLNTAGYPDDTTLAFARHASVSSYMSRIKVPTLLVQGEHDSLFNLQEAVATFRALRAQGTETRMVWFSGGHSGSTAPGDFDLSRGVDYSYLGRRAFAWMERYVRGVKADPGPCFEYFRDWVHYDTSAAAAGTDVAKAYAQADSFTGAPTSTLFLTGTDGLTADSAKVQAGSAQFGVTPAGTSYSETSHFEGNELDNPPSDTSGTFASYTSPVLSKPAVLVGSPKLTVRLQAPVAAGAQAGGPAGKLVLFAKLYDVAPDGTKKLQYRLVSPVRIGDVTKPVTIELPAVAQQFPAGHKIQLVIAGGDMAYANNHVAQPVTVVTDPGQPGRLALPLVGGLAF